MSLRGGESPFGAEFGTLAQAPASFPPVPPLGPSIATGATQDVAIHAVIVSGVQSPWKAISKAAGVRNITLTGGLVALGRSPRSNETAAGGSPPSFLKIIPDAKLLNGSLAPPIVPNVVDVRIVGYSVTADMPAD